MCDFAPWSESARETAASLTLSKQDEPPHASSDWTSPIPAPYKMPSKYGVWSNAMASLKKLPAAGAVRHAAEESAGSAFHFAGLPAKWNPPLVDAPKARKRAILPLQGLRGSELVTAFIDDKGFVSVERIAERFGMSKVQLAETIGVKRETVHRTARRTAPKTQARATEMLEIVGRVVDWAGGEKQAMAWYRAEPIAAFGGRTAEALVKEGRASAVRDYLDHVATGGFA
jgi:uncharacterized protein (DUF2384 family)